MDPYLITLTIRPRVEATPEAVLKATTGAFEQKHKLLVLGLKGGVHLYYGADVNKHTPEEWLKVAKMGLVYVEHFSEQDLHVFAADVDRQSGALSLPELMKDAMARRSYSGKPEEKKEQQAALPLTH